MFKYASVHMTLFFKKKLPLKLSPAYFNSNGEVPEVILTTLSTNELADRARRTGNQGVERVGFHSFMSVKRVARLIQGVIVEEFLYKVVSPVKLGDKVVHEIFGAAEGDSDVCWHIPAPLTRNPSGRELLVHKWC